MVATSRPSPRGAVVARIHMRLADTLFAACDGGLSVIARVETDYDEQGIELHCCMRIRVGGNVHHAYGTQGELITRRDAMLRDARPIMVMRRISSRDRRGGECRMRRADVTADYRD